MLRSVTATGSGVTAGILAEGSEGKVFLRVRNPSGWTGEVAEIEAAPADDPEGFAPFGDGHGRFWGKQDFAEIVPTGLVYRLNVTGHAGSDITLSLHRVGKDWESNRYR